MPQFNFEGTYNLKVGDGLGENIGEILHTHASLYVLAEKWGVDRLKSVVVGAVVEIYMVVQRQR